VRGTELSATDVVIDLGSGGGLPGLVLATATSATLVLVEGSARRAAWLKEAVGALGLSERVEVLPFRAEVVGRDPDRRGRATVVVARAFAPPAVTAECAAPLLRVGGHLVVSEPPDVDERRWPGEGLARVGLTWSASVAEDGGHFAVLRQQWACPVAYPRRVGVPERRPLF
jgi:16S rRNA (guanine527-N7)-methyltransferase